MIKKYFASGDKIELQFTQKGSLGQEGTEIKKIYISKINQILDEYTIEVLMPIDQSKMVLLPRNIRGSMVVYTSHGLYQCDIRVGGRYKDGGSFLQVVEIISGIKKYQRREFYRYNCSVPIYSRRLTEEEKENYVWDETNKGSEGYTYDIGGGGVRYMTAEEIHEGDTILCYLELQTDSYVKEIQAIGKVLSKKPIEFSRKHEVRVQFEKISAEAREEIVQYIFEDERKRRKKNSGL